MLEKRAWGRGSSAAPERLGPRLVVLCLWLGLATPQMAQAQLHKGKEIPSHKAEEGIKNIQLTVPFTGAPASLQPTGKLKLIPKAEDTGKALPGSYTIENGTLTATFPRLSAA